MTASWIADKIEQWPAAKRVPYARNSRTHSDIFAGGCSAGSASFSLAERGFREGAGGVD